MDTALSAWWIATLLLIAGDVLLWTFAFVADVGPDGRFRLVSAAALLLLVVLAMFVGWWLATLLWFAGLWVYAVVAGIAKPSGSAA